MSLTSLLPGTAQRVQLHPRSPSAVSTSTARSLSASLQSALPTETNVYASHDLQLKGASSGTRLTAAVDSNQTTSLTPFLQNRLSLTVKRGYLDEVLDLLDKRAQEARRHRQRKDRAYWRSLEDKKAKPAAAESRGPIVFETPHPEYYARLYPRLPVLAAPAPPPPAAAAGSSSLKSPCSLRTTSRSPLAALGSEIASSTASAAQYDVPQLSLARSLAAAFSPSKPGGSAGSGSGGKAGLYADLAAELKAHDGPGHHPPRHRPRIAAARPPSGQRVQIPRQYDWPLQSHAPARLPNRSMLALVGDDHHDFASEHAADGLDIDDPDDLQSAAAVASDDSLQQFVSAGRSPRDLSRSLAHQQQQQQQQPSSGRQFVHHHQHSHHSPQSPRGHSPGGRRLSLSRTGSASRLAAAAAGHHAPHAPHAPSSSHVPASPRHRRPPSVSSVASAPAYGPGGHEHRRRPTLSAAPLDPHTLASLVVQPGMQRADSDDDLLLAPEDAESAAAAAITAAVATSDKKHGHGHPHLQQQHQHHQASRTLTAVQLRPEDQPLQMHRAQAYRLQTTETIDFVDRNGSTPLFHGIVLNLFARARSLMCWCCCAAAWENHVQIAQLLLEAGADVNWRNVRGNTALDMALEKGHADLVRLLLRFGAHMPRARAQATLWRARMKHWTRGDAGRRAEKERKELLAPQRPRQPRMDAHLLSLLALFPPDEAAKDNVLGYHLAGRAYHSVPTC
jgi:hypothetical protein